MRTDEASVANGDPVLAALMRKGVTVAHILDLLQTAFPKTWERHLRNRLGATNPAELTPTELAGFLDHIFWLVKQTGIKDPAAWLAFRAQLDAEAAPAASAKPGSLEQRNSAEREPVMLENSPPTATSPRPVARGVASGTTKAEVLSRAKAGVETGESPRDTAKRLASAQEDFHASQREIARAIGRSASWVNRLLKWRRSGSKQSSPFGPTTRAGRAAHRKESKKDSAGCEGAEQLPRHGSPPCQPSSPAAPMNEDLPSRSPRAKLLSSAEAAARESKEPKTRATPLGDPGCEQGRSGSRQPEKQGLAASNSEYRKLLHKRMRIVLDSLRERPILSDAARRAGIHRRTPENWLKRSKAGGDGYDLEWQGVTMRFHEHYESAIEEGHDPICFLMWQRGMGIKFKIDPLLVELGYQGLEVYAQDENGDFIVEAVTRPNPKMLRLLLEGMRPEKWGKHRKSDTPQTGGVLVIDERTKKSKNSCAASIKARKWKSLYRKLQQD